LSSPATVSGNTVVLNYAAAQYSNIVAIAGTQLMLPANFGTANSPAATAAVTAPVGTGPYLLNNYSSTLVSYKANPHYWVVRPRRPRSTFRRTRPTLTRRPHWRLDNWIGLVNDIANVNKIFVDAKQVNQPHLLARAHRDVGVQRHQVAIHQRRSSPSRKCRREPLAR